MERFINRNCFAVTDLNECSARAKHKSKENEKQQSQDLRSCTAEATTYRNIILRR